MTDSLTYLPRYDVLQRIAEDSATVQTQPVRPEELFGSLSRLSEPASATTQATTLRPPATFSAAPLYHACAIGLLACYCAVLLTHRGNIVALLRSIAGRVQFSKILDVQNHSFTAMLRSLELLGLLMAAMMILKLADSTESVSQLPEWAVEWAVPEMIAVLWAVTALEWTVLRLTGSITNSKGFVGSLLRLRKVIFASGTAVFAPGFLLLALASGKASGTLICLAAGAWILLLLQKTFKLFVDQKISILHWFLYLCAVEIFPPSLAIFLALRAG